MILRSLLKKISDATKNVVAPPYCVHCKKWLTERCILCQDCLQHIKPIVSRQLMVTQSWGITVHALSDYKDPLKTLIKAKYYGDRIAAADLGHLIWQMSYFKNIPCDYLVPIPLHWTRYAWRGFNPTQEIARVLGRYRSVPVVSLLKRVRVTKFQAQLTRELRTKNLKEAFGLKNVDTGLFKNKHIILIDDLMTTGTTLQEAALVLKKLGPTSITAVVGCRVL